MKRSIRTMLGVTLLEIMLVLAIAGAVIALSIRYYQQAATNQKVTAGMSAVMAVSAAMEQYILSGKSSKESVNLSPYFPGSKLPTSPWTSDELAVTPGTNNGSYSIEITTSDANACFLLIDQIKTQPNFKNSSCEGTTGVVSVNPL